MFRIFQIFTIIIIVITLNHNRNTRQDNKYKQAYSEGKFKPNHRHRPPNFRNTIIDHHIPHTQTEHRERLSSPIYDHHTTNPFPIFSANLCYTHTHTHINTKKKSSIEVKNDSIKEGPSNTQISVLGFHRSAQSQPPSCNHLRKNLL